MKTIRNMKHNAMRFIAIALLMATVGVATRAQQVNTLYFLENTPMRHLINPAFQPVSNGYVVITPLGYSSLWLGNNSFTMADVLYPNPNGNGSVITPLHPNADRQKFLRSIRKSTLINGEVDMNILGFGFRLKEKGFVTIGIQERIDMGGAMPKGLFTFLLDGGMKDLQGVNNIRLGGMGVQTQVYTEIYGGYSHKINDQWTVGGKLKFLLGTAYIGLNTKNIDIDASMEQWRLKAKMDIDAAAPLNWDNMPNDPKELFSGDFDFNKLMPQLNSMQDYLKLATPSGYGAAIDLGATYKPHEMVQITAALTDLGFIYWNSSKHYNAMLDTVFTGVGEIEIDHYMVDGQFDSDSLMRDVTNNMKGLFMNRLQVSGKKGFTRMPTAKLNIGVDANFWDNRIGVGVLSQTRLYNNKVYEEVTLGAALRPCNWFNLAVSYSLVNNGKYSNIGAGISLMPYDGINLTLAADYIPTSYAATDIDGKEQYIIPYKTKGVNLAMGLSIVWGTNKKKDKDKDGVLDKWDMCPGTPKGVRVDTLGCPIDSDGDGVPDYLDQCVETPVSAYGLIDSVGCPTDEDGDGVPDYMDECPGTPFESREMVDANGCSSDSDHDGVPDYLDQCPNTPSGAIGYVDENGCELDSDGDGVPDWIDRCPETPLEARETVDAYGCPMDSDGDGVPDYLDECPGTIVEARGHVDEKGCEKDTDGDGVMDWCDECPTVAGVKENKGCPALKKSYTNILKKAMSGIQFETGKAVIKKSSNTILNQVADIFLEDTTFHIEVQGHTDNVGKPEANKLLSQKRAEAVRDYMFKRGVAMNRMTAVGYGDEKPIETNATAAGRAKNRRVEFIIIYEEHIEETIMDHADPVTEPAADPVVEPAPAAADTIATVAITE